MPRKSLPCLNDRYGCCFAGPPNGNAFMDARISIARKRILLLTGLALGLGLLLPAIGRDRTGQSALRFSAAEARELAKAVAVRAAEVKKHIDKEVTDLEGLYKQLHSNPELSLREFRSAARMAEE